MGGALAMLLKRLEAENFTVFKDLKVDFSNGINIFIGENGTGKTHLMKILYAATQAARHDVSFTNKLVRLFKPDNMEIHRLLSRAQGNTKSNVTIFADDGANISVGFHNKTKK